MPEWHLTLCARPGHSKAMNRIRQIRELRGLSQSQLAELCGTSQPQIARLETGERELTEYWMRAIARALDVKPADLLEVLSAAEIDDEIEPARRGDGVSGALSTMGLALYVVKTDNVALAGVRRGQTIVADERAEALNNIAMGAVVVVSVDNRAGKKARLLRQYLPPQIIVTNRPGNNVAMSLDDPLYEIEVVGVVRRE